jgi:hypothetical protein
MTAPTLTLETAEELAHQFALALEHLYVGDELPASAREALAHIEGGDRLEAWVRERMAAEVERRERLRCWPDDVEPGCQWDGLADNDREALAHAVMTDLGLDDGPAWALCEAATKGTSEGASLMAHAPELLAQDLTRVPGRADASGAPTGPGWHEVWIDGAWRDAWVYLSEADPEDGARGLLWLHPKTDEQDGVDGYRWRGGPCLQGSAPDDDDLAHALSVLRVSANRHEAVEWREDSHDLHAALDIVVGCLQGSADADAIADARHSMMTARAERDGALGRLDALTRAVEAEASRLGRWSAGQEPGEGGVDGMAERLRAALDAAKGQAPTE